MNFVYAFHEDEHKNSDIHVFADHFSRIFHRTAVPESITVQASAHFFIDAGLLLHVLPLEPVSCREPWLTDYFG